MLAGRKDTLLKPGHQMSEASVMAITGSALGHGHSASRQAARKLANAQRWRAEAHRLIERAERAERDAANWQRGADGEQTVGAQLEMLRPHGFDVLHDLHWPGRPRANIDHVAIGPPGILVVDAKNWSGDVTVRAGVLRQNGYQRDYELAGVTKASEAVGGLLQLPWALHVIPVIALAASDAGGVSQAQGVTVLGHQNLVGWATGLPPRLTPGDVLGIASQLRSAIPPASVPLPRRGRGSRAPRPPREPSARQRQRAAKRAADRRENLIKLAGVLLLLILAPAAFKWWSSHGTDVVRSVIPTPTFSAAAATPQVSTQAFADCRGLRRAYPYGVMRTGAANTGKKPRGTLVIDSAVYRANAALDHDRDGIACERTKAAAHHRG
jgi:hypothetical protein